MTAVLAHARTHAHAGVKGRSPYVDNLRGELESLIGSEVDITVQVGVMMAAGMPKTTIQDELGIGSTEFKMCLARLEWVAYRWRNG